MPTPAAAPVGMAAQSPSSLTPTVDASSSICGPTRVSSGPIGVSSPESLDDPSTGGGEFDVRVSPMLTSTGSNADDTMSSSKQGGALARVARRLERTAADRTGTLEERTRADQPFCFPRTT